MKEIYLSLLKNGFKEDWMTGDWEKDKKRFIREQENLNKLSVEFNIEEIFDDDYLLQVWVEQIKYGDNKDIQIQIKAF